ncbi:transcriptional regulator [Bacillus velezensis]|uniref:helix-turn-helix domain-containing protein n=1 Tax=Bacillus velezensis TaxID=492670 RepID=UPI00073BE3EF|nr:MULTISPECIES: helix-turn-helix domain-containing protein [Bacillus amyloliquefaciens group]KSW07142.1 transcriptional regulator [Bacillus velezensis]
MNFSNRLKDLRVDKRLKQQEVADKLGIARTTYASYEQGKREPDHETLIKISDFFCVSIDYLLRGQEYYQDKAKELRKQNDVRFDNVKGQELMTEDEKDKYLADALRRLDGIEKMIAENFKNKKEEK